MELYQLKCFLAAANCENFSRAAEEVHISQSSISKVIGRLEEELGVPLFERGHGRIMLNANGILFQKYAATAQLINTGAAIGIVPDELYYHRKQATPRLPIKAIPINERWYRRIYLMQREESRDDVQIQEIYQLLKSKLLEERALIQEFYKNRIFTFKEKHMNTYTCDIAVIGGGGSGLVAACRAAALGKRAIVLEKDKRLGGGMNMASTMRTFGSKWQKERNLPDTTALFLRNRMDETYWRLDRKLAVSMIRGTGEFFDWFCSIAPQETVDRFTVGRYVFDEEADGPLGPQCGGDGPGKGAGRIFMEVMIEQLEKLGAVILTEAVTRDIRMDGARITGLTAVVAGEPIEIQCESVILACGAWIRNPEVVRRYFPELAAAQPYMGESPHMSRNYTGDGLKLAQDAGAKMDETNRTIRMMGPMTMCRSRVMGEMANSAYSIYINRNGQRYVCEASQLRMGIFDSGSVQVDQPEGLAYVVFDENNLRHAIAAGTHQPQTQIAMPFGPSRFPATMEEAKQDMLPALEKQDGVLFAADTLDELAEKIGVPADHLKETVAAYNHAAETGMDWDCFKPADWLTPIHEAPYYAVKATLGTDGAFGGVEINENMQAKSASGGVVDGLYVVGDLASGRFLNMCGIKKQILNDMSFALSSGFVAGTHAAGKS